MLPSARGPRRATPSALRSRAAQNAQQLERDLARDAYQDQDVVFCNELGGTIAPVTLTAEFRRHRTEAGILTGHLHILRHTCATLALTATPPVPPHVVAGRLADDPKTLLATYAHVLAHSDEVAAEAVAAALGDKPLTKAPA